MVRTTLFLALFGYVSAGAGATVNWDGETLIPIGLEARSEAVLRLPEPIAKYWAEEDTTVSISTVDQRTFTIKPTAPATEQRLFLRGASGKIFIAKLSTSLNYYPYVEVLDKTVPQDAAGVSKTTKAGAPAVQIGPEGLLLAMMKNTLPTGYGEAASAREILRTEDFVIRATAVWSSPVLTGVFATVERQGALGREVRLSPTAIEVVIPEFGGTYRYVAADRWTLSDAVPHTTMYFVFEKL